MLGYRLASVVSACALLAASGPAVGAVVTYTALSGVPATYSEAGLDHLSYYTSGTIPTTLAPALPAGHFHTQNVAGDPYIVGHGSCCSDYGQLVLVNGGTFTLVSIDVTVAAGTAIWTAAGGTQVTIGATGTHAFGPAFVNVPWVGVYFPGGTFGWDDLVFDPTPVEGDGDGDAMPDAWELSFGLDPNDPADGLDDPDGDNRSNVQEYQDGTDPTVFNGPTMPLPLEPIDEAPAESSSPDLTWSSASDPDGDPLTYDVAVYTPDLENTVTSVSGLLGGAEQWTVDVGLVEGADYAWRVRAQDPWVAGPWSPLGRFFVDAVNVAPPAPVLVSPEDGAEVATISPELVFEGVVDPDRSSVSYEIEVSGDDLLAEGVAESADDPVAWDDGALRLIENGAFAWRVRAVDERGLAGGWSESWSLVVNAVEEPPSTPSILEPLDGYEDEAPPPLVVLTEAVDPEGGEVVYRLQLGTDPAFDAPTADFILPPFTDDGPPTWQPAEGRIVPDEPATWHLRARAEDDAGQASEWSEVTFVVAAPEDPLPGDDDDDDDPVPGCEGCSSAGPGGSFGWAALLLVSGGAVRRRRAARNGSPVFVTHP